MAVGATHQGEEEDARPPQGHHVPEDPQPPWGRRHQGYHTRRVAPLMARILPLYEMMPGM